MGLGVVAGLRSVALDGVTHSVPADSILYPDVPTGVILPI